MELRNPGLNSDLLAPPLNSWDYVLVSLKLGLLGVSMEKTARVLFSEGNLYFTVSAC